MNFIFQKELSIPKILCDEIITMYELENIKYPGQTVGGVLKDVKDTTDMTIPKDIKWYKIEEFLYRELHKSIKEYLEYLDFINNIVKTDSKTDSKIKYNFFNTNQMHTDSFLIQKYNQQEGKYVYHNDSYVKYSENRHRVLTFLWYLNDVEIGGETEFWFGEYLVKPQKGKLIIFPACWSYPHAGKMPISSDKYIITGWLYINEPKYTECL